MKWRSFSQFLPFSPPFFLTSSSTALSSSSPSPPFSGPGLHRHCTRVDFHSRRHLPWHAIECSLCNWLALLLFSNLLWHLDSIFEAPLFYIFIKFFLPSFIYFLGTCLVLEIGLGLIYIYIYILNLRLQMI